MRPISIAREDLLHSEQKRTQLLQSSALLQAPLGLATL